MKTKQETGADLRTIAVPGGEEIPVLGQGTWGVAERDRKRADEIVVLQMTDSACEASLRRLQTDRLDLYLVHWRRTVPLDETLEAFNSLKRQEKIRYWGVSNFDVNDMEHLVSLTAKGDSMIASNQVLYNLTHRGIEYALLPWCRARGIPIVAYSPLGQGQLGRDATVSAIAHRLDATAAEVALAWVLRQEGVAAIPKAASFEHVRENRGSLEIALAAEDLEALDQAFPPPSP